MLKSLPKRREKMVLVKEPNEFIKGKYKLSAFTLKVLAFLFSKIDPFEDEPFKKYEISIKELQEVYGKNYGEIYNVVKKTFRELMDIKIELEYKDKWTIFTIVVDPTITKRNGTITFFISPNLLTLLKNSKHFLKYDISVLAYFNSSYSVRLYKILKDRLEINNKFKENNKYLLGLEEFRTLLQIPSTYKFGDIKRKVLTPALKEINKYSELTVEIEEIKKGRKVEKLLFYISSKKDPKSFVTPPKKKKEEKSIANDLKQFRQEIIQKFSNKEKYFIIDHKIFKIKEDLLFVNDKALNSSEALTWWKYIYKNRDKIKEIDPQEEAQKVWEETLKEINKEYKGKITLIVVGGEYKEVEIIKIDGTDLDNLEVYFKDLETNKIYKGNYSLDSLKNLTK